MELVLLCVLGSLLFGEVVAPTPPCGGPCPVATPCCEPLTDSCQECCEDAECATPPNLYCDVINHVCVECFTDEYCNVPYPVCNTATSHCEIECNSTTECGTNEVCDTTRGLCVCATDSLPCSGAYEYCGSDGNCICDPGYYRNADGDCVQDCMIDSDCLNNGVCTVNGECVCPVDNLPCDAPNEICDIDGYCGCVSGHIRDLFGDCVQDCNPPCSGDRICTRLLECVCEPGKVEQGGVCVTCQPGCLNHADCRNEGELCNENNLCECPPDERLFRGRCVEAGQLGGMCIDDKCFGRSVQCDVVTNTCVCRGNCEPKTVCLKDRLAYKKLWKTKPTKG